MAEDEAVSASEVDLEVIESPKGPSRFSNAWWKGVGNRIWGAMETVGAVVSNLMGLEDSLFQDIVDEMDPEDYARAMAVHREREEQYRIYDAEQAAKAEAAEALRGNAVESLEVEGAAAAVAVVGGIEADNQA